MGLMDRFKKKDDDLEDLDTNPIGQPPGQEIGGDPFAEQGQQPTNPSASNDFNAPPTSQDPLGMGQEYDNPDLNAVKGIERPKAFEEYGQHQPQPSQSQPTGHTEKDLQIIIAKLDAIKSELDSLHQRVQKIEKIADEDQANAKRREQRQYRW